MADNYQIRDGNTNLVTIKAKDTTGSGGPIIPQSVPSDATGNPYGDSNPSSVAVQARQANYTDRSGTVNTSSIQVAPANTSRKGFFIQNLDQSHFMYLNFGVAASNAPGSLTLAPLEKYEVPLHMMTTAAIYVIGSVTGQTFTAKEC